MRCPDFAITVKQKKDDKKARGEGEEEKPQREVTPG
jgi:hypothetical protein